VGEREGEREGGRGRERERVERREKEAGCVFQVHKEGRLGTEITSRLD
jgi:hypothetical protein